MEKKTVKIPKEEYESMKEELEILRNKELVEAIKDNEKAKKQSSKTWELEI